MVEVKYLGCASEEAGPGLSSTFNWRRDSFMFRRSWRLRFNRQSRSSPKGIYGTKRGRFQTSVSQLKWQEVAEEAGGGKREGQEVQHTRERHLQHRRRWGKARCWWSWWNLGKLKARLGVLRDAQGERSWRSHQDWKRRHEQAVARQNGVGDVMRSCSSGASRVEDPRER